jgi:hypothetical protein
MTTTVNGTTGAVTNGQHSSWQSKHQVPAHFIGGNHLDAAAPGVVKDFVQNSEGHSVITSVSPAKLVQASLRVLTCILPGSHCQQWYCRSQRNQIRAKMGLRNPRRRAGDTIYSDGYTGRFAGECRLYSNGGSVCRGMTESHKHSSCSSCSSCSSFGDLGQEIES